MPERDATVRETESTLNPILRNDVAAALDSSRAVYSTSCCPRCRRVYGAV